MKRKHHDEIVEESYREKVLGPRARNVGKSRTKSKKHKRPSCSMLLKSAMRKVMIK